MKNEKISKIRIGRTYQSSLYFIEERGARFSNCESIDEKVWSVKDPGIQVCSAGKIKQRAYGCSRDFYCLYSQTAAQSDQPGQKFCKFQGDINQQSGQSGAGRFSSQKRSWPKNRGRLKYPITMTGSGSKSFHRCTISLSQITTANSAINFLNQ